MLFRMNLPMHRPWRPHLILGNWHLLLDACSWNLEYGAWHLKPSSPGTRHLEQIIPGIGYLTSAHVIRLTWDMAPVTWHLCLELGNSIMVYGVFAIPVCLAPSPPLHPSPACAFYVVGL